MAFALVTVFFINALLATTEATRPEIVHDGDNLEAVSLPELVVVERRGFDPETGAGSTIDVGPTRSRILETSDLLSHEAGVTVRRGGGLGSFQSISIRGSAASQIQIFLNGVPLPSGLSGAMPVSLLPLDSLERIDVYRGTPPARYARSPLGGAIDIITADPQHTKAGARLAAGSFGTREVSAFAAAPQAHLLAGGGFFKSQGNFEYLDTLGTAANTADDILRKRNNNDSGGGNGFVFADVPLGNGAIRAHAIGSGSNQGLPGTGFDQASATRLDSRFVALGGEYVNVHEHGEAGVALFGASLRERFNDPHGEISYSPTRQLNQTMQGGARLRESYSLGSWQPEAVLEAETLRFSGSSPIQESPLFREHRAAGVLGLKWLAPTLSITGSAQSEWNRLTTSEAGPSGTVGRNSFLNAFKGGASIQLHPTFQFLVNAGNGYRRPSAQEQFGNRGAQVGNPGLRPETGLYGDAGFHWDRKTLHAAWAVDFRYYRQVIQDIITIYQSTPRTSRAENFDSALSTGYEVDVRFGWRALQAGANGVYQAVINTGSIEAYHGKQLPGRPRWEAGADLAYQGRHWVPFYQLDAHGGLFLDPVNTKAREIQSVFFHDIGLTYKPVSWLGITGTLENSTGIRSYDFIGLPLPGRRFGLVLQFTST